MAESEAWVMVPKFRYNADDDTNDIVLDMLPLVLCKDCKHGEPCNEGNIYCSKEIGTFESSVHKPDWFCACGERME